jgi:hypothetical protein
MSEPTCTVLEGFINDCLKISRQTPEFSDNRYDEVEYNKRLSNANYLILIAKIDKRVVGFKVGYEKE